MLFIKLLLLLPLASASAYHVGQEVNIDKSCFKGLADLKCHKFDYRIISIKDKMYEIRPGKMETIFALCADKPVKEKCLKPKR